MRQFRFSPALPERPAFTLGDAVIVLGIATILYAGIRLAIRVPAVIRAGYLSLASCIAMVRSTFRGANGGCIFSVHAVQLILRLRCRAQPHRANGAHARAGRAAKCAHSLLLAGGPA